MTLYNRTNPFIAKLLSKHRLTKIGSTKETWHIALDLEGSGFSYRPGDSFGIFPENDPCLVEVILSNCRWSGQEQVFDEKCHTHFSIREWLLKKANLAVCSKKFLLKIIDRHSEGQKKDELIQLVMPENEENFINFISTWNVPEVIAMYSEAELHPNDLMATLQPLLPRFYSIASAQCFVGNHAHFTVSKAEYEIGGRQRFGVCSHFLCDIVRQGVTPIPLYLQSTKDFLLPEDNTAPIIMIGPGTGIAPFRAFMQERVYKGAPAQKNWLFFGERHREHDFFYEEFWQELVSSDRLRLDAAFSRDQAEKIYVQHKLWQQREELWRWIQNGAKIYVCGDADRMAKDVDSCLQEIACDQAKMSPADAKALLNKLRKEKQYLRDIY